MRAMYTHPAFVRRGVGRLILSLCEDAAGAEGFARVELMATMAGEPLYRACGYQPIEQILDPYDQFGEAIVDALTSIWLGRSPSATLLEHTLIIRT